MPNTIARVSHLSRFLQRMLESRPWLSGLLGAHLDEILSAESMFAFIKARPADDAHLGAVLRDLRTWVVSHLAARDLAGLADLAEVTETMTVLAEVSIGHAHDLLYEGLEARYGVPRSPDGDGQALQIIGMGKLGGRELNVSSDIDLIFVYPEEGDTDGKRSISNYEFFGRLGKQIIKALSEITENGQVFRIDMRLRPNGDSGPLVCCFDMLENYFVTQGREWERYAWIKARVIKGSRVDELRAISRPFVFRRYLDFGAFGAMRELHGQIRREVARKDRANNIKLGPGGIREIEFIAQVFQLIRGGRDAGLQARPTLAVLAQLAERGLLAAEAVADLSESYTFLRCLEHRLQYLDDAQTHDLPTSEADQALIAEAMGFADWAALMLDLTPRRERISQHFESVFGLSESGDDGEGYRGTIWLNAANTTETAALFEGLGYADPVAAAARLAALRTGARYRQFPENIRQRYDALVPQLITVAARTKNADVALGRCLDLVDGIARRGAYLALLQQYPLALRRVVDLVAASRWAAQYLVSHPILLDELLGTEVLHTPPEWPRYKAELAAQIDATEPDMERQMDLMRESHHAQIFRLLMQDIAGLYTVEKLADHLSMLADIIVSLAITPCWRKIKTRHIESPRFAVISYGKLGGKELGYSSDLDLIYLYDDEPEAAEYYIRLAQRLSSWLSSRTSAGILFETDLRLRPNGDSGLVASSLTAFRQYQNQSAWAWEHQALTRARFTAGDPEIGAAFERIREDILRLPRDLTKLRTEVLAMREKMRAAHPTQAGLFELKHDHGGLVDVEFLIQFLILGYAHDYPELTKNLGNIALLRIASELGLLPTDLAAACADSYRNLRRLQHRQRLNDQTSRVPEEEVEAIRRPVQLLWERVFGDAAAG